MEVFSVHPSATQEKYIYYTKLPLELLDHITKGAFGKLSIKFDKDQNTFTVDDKIYSFRQENEQQDQECFIQDDNIWTKVGPVKKKLFFNIELSEEDRDRIKHRTDEAEAAKRQRISKVLDPNEIKNSRPGKKVVTHIKKTVQLPPQKTEEPTITLQPVKPPKPKAALPVLRKQLIQILAVKNLSTQQVAAKFSEETQNELIAILEDVATFKRIAWVLKPELLKEVDAEWEGYSEAEKDKVRLILKKLNSKEEEHKEKEARKDVAPMNIDKEKEKEEKKSPPAPPNPPPSETPVTSLKIKLPKAKPSTPPDAPAKQAAPAPVVEPKPSAPAKVDKEPPVVAKEVTPEVSQPKEAPKADNINKNKKEKEATPAKKEQKQPPKKEISPPKKESAPKPAREAPKAEPAQKEAKKPESEAKPPPSSEKDKNGQSVRVKIPSLLELKKKAAEEQKEESKKRKNDGENGSENSSKIQKTENENGFRSVIISKHQYLEYKSEYETKYEEYRNLRNMIEGNQKQFAELGEAWKNATDPSQKDSLDKKIQALFKENFEKVQKWKQRHAKLHHDLKELKKRIRDAEPKFGVSSSKS